jgi:hypothetical protein
MANYIKTFSIKNQWTNLSVYFINFMYNTKRISFLGNLFTIGLLITSPLSLLAIANLIRDSTRNDDTNVCRYITLKDRLKDNDAPIGGLQKNNKWLASGDHINTDFIKLDKTDFISLYENDKYGFTKAKKDLKSPTNYKRADNLIIITNQDNNGNLVEGDKLIYFLKATQNNDILEYLRNSKII